MFQDFFFFCLRPFKLTKKKKMFKGSLDFSGAPIIENIVTLLGFLTIVLYLAQDKSVTIPILDIIQTFLCWPTIFEGIHIAFCMWSLRHIERLLGLKSFTIYLLYNFITYVPIFLFVLLLKGFKGHFSFLFFVPFSLFIFMIWRLPSEVYSGPLTDKFIVCLSFVFVVILRFPYSILVILSSALGYYLWARDYLMIKRLASIEIDRHAPAFSDHSSRSHNNRNTNSSEQSPLLAASDAIENSNEEEPFALPINRNTRENGRRSSRSSTHSDHNNNNNNAAFNRPNNSNSSNGNNDFDSLVAQIVAMGFSGPDARSALQTTRGDINAAVDYLLSKA